MKDIEEYEKRREIIRVNNKKLLQEFEAWLKKQGLSQRTIDKHSGNVDFFVNHYLLYSEEINPEDGFDLIGDFLGYWYIKKAMWANASNIKENATSLKKFYAFMLENGKIEQQDFDALKEEIKNELPEWVATVKRYDDPSLDIEDVWKF